MEDLRLLHIGCADKYYKGFINSDLRTEWKGKPHKLDVQMDITVPWPYDYESVDGIVSMHVLQQLHWRDLVFALKETYRVLKETGVMRIGVPTIDTGRDLDLLLGWNNINLLSYELLSWVLKKIGFTVVKQCKYQESMIEEFKQVDNRPEQTIYIEVMK